MGGFLCVALSCNILSWGFAHKNRGAFFSFFLFSQTSKSNTADDIISKSRALLVTR